MKCQYWIYQSIDLKLRSKTVKLRILKRYVVWEPLIVFSPVYEIVQSPILMPKRERVSTCNWITSSNSSIASKSQSFRPAPIARVSRKWRSKYPGKLDEFDTWMYHHVSSFQRRSMLPRWQTAFSILTALLLRSDQCTTFRRILVVSLSKSESRSLP